MGQSSDDLLRNFGNTSDASLFVQHRRHNGYIVQVFVLESLLLCLWKETEQDDQSTKYERIYEVRKNVNMKKKCCLLPNKPFCRQFNDIYLYILFVVSAPRFTRTKNASFRRSVRTSTRSADSGFAAFSDCSPAYHSDSDLRYCF